MKFRVLLGLLGLMFLAGCSLPLPVAVPAADLPSEEPAASAEPAPTVDPATVSIAGTWDGAISILGAQLRIIVDLAEADGEWRGTLDIPQQGAIDLPLTNVEIAPPRIYFEILPGPRVAVHEGEVQPDGSIAGVFRQSGFEGTFQLRKVEPVAALPEEPAPYEEEEVTFSSGDITLAGTLTLPEGPGPHPAVVLVSGSGPQNRNEEIATIPDYRPFAVIADALTRQGIAVLRYDDRGVGESTGDFDSATLHDFSNDAAAALSYLQERPDIDPAQIGIFGHSEGGQVASRLAAGHSGIAFIILMAGPGERGDEILNDQILYLMEAAGADAAAIEATLALQQLAYDTVRADEGWEELEAAIRQDSEASLADLTDEQREALGDIDALLEQSVAARMAGVRSDWFREFINYDPAEDLSQVQIPVLALYGGLDVQVPAEANAAALEAALAAAGNEDVTVVTFPEANHLFQHAESGHPDEYALLSTDFVPGFLETIEEWLLERITIVP